MKNYLPRRENMQPCGENKFVPRKWLVRLKYSPTEPRLLESSLNVQVPLALEASRLKRILKMKRPAPLHLIATGAMQERSPAGSLVALLMAYVVLPRFFAVVIPQTKIVVAAPANLQVILKSTNTHIQA
jgi:hypothetical protein